MHRLARLPRALKLKTGASADEEIVHNNHHVPREPGRERFDQSQCWEGDLEKNEVEGA